MPTICLSTAEAEYYALPQSMQLVIPMLALIHEMLEKLDFPKALQVSTEKLKATVHEDNIATLTLANEQRISSCTRYYHQRTHLF